MIRVELGRCTPYGTWSYSVAGYGVEGRSHQPMLDACRQIKRAFGDAVDRQISLYRPSRETPDAVCGLDWGADHTVRETPRRGPWFVKWRPDPRWEKGGGPDAALGITLGVLSQRHPGRP
jgi:hypothetical protein